jgi:hypothetical protein
VDIIHEEKYHGEKACDERDDDDNDDVSARNEGICEREGITPHIHNLDAR